jgi:hypothetical protein
MRVLFVILILLEMLLVMLVFTPMFMDRHDLASAVVAYHRDPSQDNLRELETQQRITQQIRFHFTASVVVLLVLNSCGLFFVGRRASKRPSNKSLQPTPAAPGVDR